MRRAHTTMLGALIALVALPGSVAAQEGPGADAPPMVSNAQISASSLTYQGGQVTISADGTDDIGITMFYADVQGSNGTGESVQLIPSGETTYSGVYNVPSNYTDSPVSYYVTVQATDTNGATATEIAGEIEVAAQPQFDEAPVVYDPSVTPRELPAASGPVTIQVSASDLRGITEAYATIALPGGGTMTVALEPIDFDRFAGVFTPPPNSGTTTQRYGIALTALDDIGQPGSIDGGVVTVAARAAPSGHSSPCKGRNRRSSAHRQSKPRAPAAHRPTRCGRGR